MKLDFNIQLNQKQGLALTAQVQQAIKLLHMTNLEIQKFVSEQFQDNPFIETNDFSESRDNPEAILAKHTEVDKSFEENPYAKQETETKVSIENQFETGEGYIPRSTVSKAEERGFAYCPAILPTLITGTPISCIMIKLVCKSTFTKFTILDERVKSKLSAQSPA